MRRIMILLTVALIASPPAFARGMDSGDAAVAQNATPAVVNIAIWKVRPPAKPGGAEVFAGAAGPRGFQGVVPWDKCRGGDAPGAQAQGSPSCCSPERI